MSSKKDGCFIYQNKHSIVVANYKKIEKKTKVKVIKAEGQNKIIVTGKKKQQQRLREFEPFTKFDVVKELETQTEQEVILLEKIPIKEETQTIYCPMAIIDEMKDVDTQTDPVSIYDFVQLQANRQKQHNINPIEVNLSTTTINLDIPSTSITDSKETECVDSRIRISSKVKVDKLIRKFHSTLGLGNLKEHEESINEHYLKQEIILLRNENKQLRDEIFLKPIQFESLYPTDVSAREDLLSEALESVANDTDAQNIVKGYFATS